MKTPSRKLLGLLALAMASFAPFSYSQEPDVTSAQVELLKSLPYSVGDRVALILRTRQVKKVKFSGAAGASKYGFIGEKGIAQEGLWFRLKNNGRENWASCSIWLDKNVNASKYNSMVLWLRATEESKRFFITVQDKSWTSLANPQGRTIVFPKTGLAKDKILQLVVPFLAFESKGNIGFSSLSRIGFEFGTLTTGSTPLGTVEILGLAFVEQESPPDKILIIDPQPTAKQGTKRIGQEAAKLSVLNEAPVRPTPLAPVVAKVKEKDKREPVRTVKVDSLAEVKEAAPLVVPPQVDLPPINHVVRERRSLLKSARTEKKKTNLPTHQRRFEGQGHTNGRFSVNFFLSPQMSDWMWIGDRVVVEAQHLFARSEVFLKDPFSFPTVLFCALGLVSAGVLFFALRRPQKGNRGLGKVIHRVNWPYVVYEVGGNFKIERQFWKSLSQKEIRTAWIAPYQIGAQKSKEDGYDGELFLAKQVRLADEEGITLLPSLCFVRSVFNFETFLVRPSLFLTKPISPSEIHLSDEELRIRHIGFFPVWIPPFWQKKHGLPQKLLVAYGKLPGAMSSSDSVQFNLRSEELKALAVRVLEGFAKTSLGVRIEGTTALLNSSLDLYWNGQFGEAVVPYKKEFWAEVIGAVKSKHPELLFVADGAGAQAQKIRELGFDYFENDQLTEILINQIRLENVGSLEKVLSSDSARDLKYSIYDIAALTRSLPTQRVGRQQNLLCCMILGLLPGIIQHDGQLPANLNQFYKFTSRWPVLIKGDFVLLRSNSEDVLAFARWEGRTLNVVVANFSMSRQDVGVRLDPFLKGVEARKIYLFNDDLHGSGLLQHLKNELADAPALAVLGEDLHESGLSFTISELSLRLFSVNLATPVSHEKSTEIRQLHKT